MLQWTSHLLLGMLVLTTLPFDTPISRAAITDPAVPDVLSYSVCIEPDLAQQSATNPDFQRTMEETAGYPLDLFFNQWVYTAGQEDPRHISVHIPTPEQEAQQVWNTIRDINFFDQHGYTINLPQGPLIDTLLQRARQGQLSDTHFNQLSAFMENTVFRKEDYEKGHSKTQARLPQLNKMIAQIDTTNYHWPFKRFPHYQVYLTLYGPGGSYNPDAGTIILYTTTKGQFKQYDDPANTLIHEIVHIGIENAIIQRYQVPHPLKERLVDTFVIKHFGQQLPEYRRQNMGDPNIDPLLTQKSDFQNLHQIVETFLAKK